MALGGLLGLINAGIGVRVDVDRDFHGNLLHALWVDLELRWDRLAQSSFHVLRPSEDYLPENLIVLFLSRRDCRRLDEVGLGTRRRLLGQLGNPRLLRWWGPLRSRPRFLRRCLIAILPLPLGSGRADCIEGLSNFTPRKRAACTGSTFLGVLGMRFSSFKSFVILLKLNC